MKYQENLTSKIMKFILEEHKNAYNVLMEEINADDVYCRAFAYLVTLDAVCRDHIDELYDFDYRCVSPQALEKGWQTSTSLRTTLLAFNLYTGHTNWCPREYIDQCTPANIFLSEYAEYYWEAIKIRFERE